VVEKLGGFVDGFDKIDDPLIKGTIFERDKSEGKTKKSSKGAESPFNKKVGAGVKGNPGSDNAGSQFQELLEGHAADKAEFIGNDVLRNRVLLHNFIIDRRRIDLQGK